MSEANDARRGAKRVGDRMRLAMLFAAFALALLPLALAEDDSCVEAYDLMPVTQTMILCTKAYDLPSGLTIKTSNITLDCNGALMRGTGVQEGTGITLDNVENVEVKNCNLLNYNTGVLLQNSNRNHIDKNNLLKDNIGIKLFESFENRFESNSDKSLVAPVSAIASKFNTVLLSRTDIDPDFCQVNACNTRDDINPCGSDDLYCSPRCSWQNDKDCPLSAEQQAVEAVTEYPALPNEPKTPITPYGSQPAASSPAPKLVSGAVTRSFMQHFGEKTQFWILATLALVSYLLAFLCFQHHHYKHVD